MRSFGSTRVRLPGPVGRQRIGLLGGSFNPPHVGHRHVAETALRRLQLDRVWFLVTPGNPLKARHALASLPDRLAATARLAAHPAMAVTAFEAELGLGYSVQTLSFLRRRASRARFVWLLGADAFAGLHRWRNWRELAALMPIAVVDRPGWRLKALASPAAHAFARGRVRETEALRIWRRPRPSWVFLTARLEPVSSTAIRAQRSEIQ